MAEVGAEGVKPETAAHVIIALCLVVFFHFEAGEAGRVFVETHVLRPGVFIPTYASPVLSVFVHRDLGHLIYNALAVWVLAWNFGESRGLAVLALFVAAGAVGLAVQAFVCAAFSLPVEYIVGASGGVCGLVGAHLRLTPRFRCPFTVAGAWVAPPFALGVGAWVVFEMVQTFVTRGLWCAPAHVTGLGVGYALAPLLAHGRRFLVAEQCTAAEPGIERR